MKYKHMVLNFFKKFPDQFILDRFLTPIYLILSRTKWYQNLQSNIFSYFDDRGPFY